jgi:hypothetical protein
MSTSTEYMDGLNAPAERRFYPRVAPPSSIWVAFGPNNLGVLQDLSENGFQISTPTSLAINSVYRVLIPLKPTRKTIVVTVRTIWTDDDENRSGIQLLDLSDEDRKQIREVVDAELTRLETRDPGFVDSPAVPLRVAPSTATVESRPATGIDNDAGVVNAWPAEWQREDWQHIDVEHPPGEAASAFEPNVRTKGPGESPEPVAQTSPEAEPKFAAHLESKNHRVEDAGAGETEVFQKASPGQPSELNGVDRGGDLTAEKISPDIEAQSPESSAPFFGVWAKQPPPRAERCSPGAPAELGALDGQATGPRPEAAAESSLPPIANPFDDPELNSRFQQYPQVPLPIHREFEYAPARSRRRAPISARMRAKPLIIWAAVLALVCFGANALVRYKINQTSRRFASEASKSTSAVAPSGSEVIAATHVPADSQTNANQKAEAGLNTDASAVGVSPRQSGANDSDANHSAAHRESSLDADGGADVATAPPASQHFDEGTSSSRPVARTWSAPAPNRSGSSGAAANDTPQSPNVTSSSDDAQAQSAPIVAQSRPTPPPAPATQTQGTNNAANNAAVSNTSSAASNPPVRTQQPAAAQTQTSAANSTPANTTQSRSQSQIYNANAQQQRSAVMGSINSVHSSGIFDSNDTTTANAVSAAASRGDSSNPHANANVATRNVANNNVVPVDSPQERDVEIAAPKGFTASYVDLPGEHVVRTATATVRMRRFVRVPGERIPGQRWLWRGKLNVTLGDVVNRIDPTVVQASGATGSLTVQATIDKDGYVTDLKPINGNFAMLPSVSRTVRNWHYQPTYLDNKRAETQAEIEFDLRPTAANNRAQR